MSSSPGTRRRPAGVRAPRVSFRFSKEVVFHGVETRDAGRFVALAMSQGAFQETLKAGAIDREPGFGAFAAESGGRPSPNPAPHGGYRMGIGVKERSRAPLRRELNARTLPSPSGAALS